MSNITEILGYTIKNSFPEWPVNKQTVINTLNPHSFCIAQKDTKFRKALKNSNILIPDGVGIVMASQILKKKKISRIAGADMHDYLIKISSENILNVFYMGSTENVLQKIKKRLSEEHPNIRVQFYSPPFRKFTKNDNKIIVEKINKFKPDILFVGLTAPKQEKWVDEHKEFLNSAIIASIGAVFDFYAGTIKRAPKWIINLGCEWLFRFFKEPKRMWKRYLVNTPKFIFIILKQKITSFK